MTREELDLFTDIRDFATQFYVFLRRGSVEWLESSLKIACVADETKPRYSPPGFSFVSAMQVTLESDMRFATWRLGFAFHDFSSFKHSF